VALVSLLDNKDENPIDLSWF